MKVLFVSSGNTKDGVSPIIRSQGESLINQGVSVEYFSIKGKGLWSYFRHIFILRKYLRTHKFDIIHSHYSLASYVASLAGARPLVVSLMGSDVITKKPARLLILLFHKFFWDRTIVKSVGMKKLLRVKNIEIIPNGVDFDRFSSIDKKDCQDRLGWDNKKKHLIFAADPSRTEKNYSLAKKTVELLKYDYELVLHVLKDIPHEDIAVYFNAADVLILSSLHEGSPNVIKEAMVCNCKIVSTDVGDVKWILGNTGGCFITSFEEEDFKEKIRYAFEFEQKTKGRDRIIELGLDSNSVALRIRDVYLKVLC